MHFTTRRIVPSMALAFALGVSPAFAQEAPAPAPRQERPAPAQAMSVEGELLRVDTEAKMIVVRGADAKQLQFRFTDTTEITGAGRNVEGLSTSTGTRVKVDYKVEGGANVATKIDIQPRSAQQAQPQSPQPQQ